MYVIVGDLDVASVAGRWVSTHQPCARCSIGSAEVVGIIVSRCNSYGEQVYLKC